MVFKAGHEIPATLDYLLVHSNKKNYRYEYSKINSLSIKKTNEPECSQKRRMCISENLCMQKLLNWHLQTSNAFL